MESVVRWFIDIGFGPAFLVVFFIIVVVSLFLAVTKPTIRWGLFSISFGKKKKVSPHANCTYNVDFTHVISKTTEIVTRICYLENVRLPERQIGYVEQKMVIVKSMVLSSYAALLAEKIDDSHVTAHNDYIIFSRLVSTMLREEYVEFLKESFFSNGFESLSDKEYKMFVREKFEYIFHRSNAFMDVWYVSERMLVPRETLRDSWDTLKDKLLDIMFDIFTHAISVKNDMLKEKVELECELEDFRRRIVGEPPLSEKK